MKAVAANRLLHITSHTHVAERMRSAGISGDIVAWQDMLYEGPVDPGDDIDRTSEIRAAYFAQLGLGDRKSLTEKFLLRNDYLKKFSSYDEIVLWFTHDLNDQLQLAQLVNWLSKRDTGRLVISLITLNRFPGIRQFYGLASLSEANLATLWGSQQEITVAQMAVCQRLWRALTSTNPNALLKAYTMDMTSMPYLKDALARLMKQFPAQSNGLSQLQSSILNAILKRQVTDDAIYRYVQSKESAPFLSLTMFHYYLNGLINCRNPLIQEYVAEVHEAIEEQEEGHFEEVVVQTQKVYRLLPTGRQILHSWVDAVQTNGIDRWIGSVHLQDGNVWRYNRDLRQLKKTYS